MEVNGNTFLISGGASGLGGATSRLLAENGANVVIVSSQGQLLRPLLTTARVGNVTTGEDNLQTNVIPAYNLKWPTAAIRTTFTGTTANNANAKTLRVYIGSTQVMTRAPRRNAS